MKLLHTFLFGCIIFNAYTRAYKNKSYMQTLYQWNMLEYQFPNQSARQEAMDSGRLIPSNGFPVDVQPYYNNGILVSTILAIPKFKNGIPFTLATVTAENGDNGPILKPYPSYEAHNTGDNCDGITSAYRVLITECNQMWVLDAGINGRNTGCPPQLLLFDLNTDQLIHRYRFNTSLYKPTASLFVMFIADVKDPPPSGSCRNTMIYIADVKFHGLVVYDFMQNKAWRVENRFMYPEPRFGTPTIAGQSFNLMDGIISLVTDKQTLYFHPLSSLTEYTVPLSVLTNSSNFANSVESMSEAFRPLGKRNGQCIQSAIDSIGNVYCVTFDPIELISWNVRTEYNTKNFKKIAVKKDDLQCVSSLKVVRNNRGKEELWMLSNKFQKFMTRTQNFNEVNFRIIVLSLDDAKYLLG